MNLLSKRLVAWVASGVAASLIARSHGGCFAPVAGYKSLIGVEEGVAYTGQIDGEPETEPLNTFLDKIRKRVG